MLKPSALKPGDTIGIAASASHFDKEQFLIGVHNLKEHGFSVYYRPDIFEKERYLAGSDQRRIEELYELLENPEIKALLFARGGYGLLRLLPLLKKKKIKSSPKIILGYSDITSLFIYLYQEYGWVTFYGPVVAKDFSSSLNEATRNHFYNAITKTKPLGPFSFEETSCIHGGQASGVMVGGCLSLVVASLGTPFEIQTKNKILFLEDTNEKPYSIDRMLTQLILAEKLDQVKGIIFGSFSNGGELAHIEEAVRDVLKDFKGPVLFNFPAGHGPLKVTLPLGIQANLDADQCRLSYLEGALQ